MKRILLLVLLLVPCVANAVTISLPWSTSFGSTALTLTYTGSEDSLVDNLYVLENHDMSAYLSTTANHPGGTGTMGYDVPIMDGVDGSQGVGLGTYFTTAQKELWFRFYVKYPVGFTWQGGDVDWHKYIYLGDGVNPNNTILGLNSGDRMRIFSYIGSDPNNYAQAANTGFQTIWGGGTLVSDGSWHCLEYHIKMDTSGANGVAEFWLDGVLKYSDTSMDYSGGNATVRQGWTLWRFNTNQSNPGNGAGGSHVYYDDVAISSTGYIGPLGSSDTTPPTISNGSPSGTLSYGTTSTNMTVTTNETATCKYSTTDTTYALMANTFTSTGGTSHSQTLTGLTNGTSYTYYVRCQDGYSNANSSSTDINFSVASASTANLLLSEGFNDTSFLSRNWLDDAIPSSVATSGCYEGAGCGQFSFDYGDTNPNEIPAGAMRHLYTASDTVYVSFWMKLSSNWIGSGQTYHPHIFMMMTDNDASNYEGPYGSVSTAYMEVLNTTPQIGFQDGLNINTSYIGTNLYGVTETRAAHGCNGWNDSNTWEVQDCFNSGSIWVNGRMTRGSSGISLNTWHHFEGYFKMNTISGGIAQPDGVMKMTVDGTVVKNYTNLILRTNTRANMKWNKVLIAPYIGDGSPLAGTQVIYLDDLEVYDAVPITSTIGSITTGGGRYSIR